MKELRIFADNGMTDDVFIKQVGAIAQIGCHSPPCENAGCLNFPCDGAFPVDEETIITKSFRTFSELNLWDEFPLSYGGSNAPSPAPTPCLVNCTDEPTHSPLTPPTFSPSVSPTHLTSKIFGRFEELKEHLERRRLQIESTVFMSETDSGLAPSKLYTLDGFLTVLEDFATEGVDGLLFNIGQVVGGDSLDHGLVNIALFLSHAMTRGILWDTCEEVNHQLVSPHFFVVSYVSIYSPKDSPLLRNHRSMVNYHCRTPAVSMDFRTTNNFVLVSTQVWSAPWTNQ